MYDLVIIGGGAASQSAAMYAMGKQLNFLLIYERFGGRVDQVEPEDRDYLVGNIVVHFDFPDVEDEERRLIGSSAVHLFERQIKSRDGRHLNDRVLRVTQVEDGFEIETEQSSILHAAAVIVATGASPRLLELPGAPAGLATCLGHSLTHHKEALRGRNVVVIGATDQALLSAAEFARTAAKVYLLLTSPAAFDRPEIEVLGRTPRLEVLPHSRIVEVRSDALTHRLVVEQEGQRRQIAVDALFYDLGYQPAIESVEALVELTADGFIKVDQHNATRTAGLFAAGDVVRAEGEQVLSAIGDGARAARSVHFYLLTRALTSEAGAGS